MGRHFNSRHDDDAWRAFFGRWHAGEPREALIAEAGVSQDTWTAHAKRLGMRIADLPEDHPRRRAPAFGERPADYRHRNSLLTEGQWAALFARRARGVPDAVLVAEYGVHAATICTQAKKRGLRREDLKAEAEEVLSRSGVRSPSVSTARRVGCLPTRGEETMAAGSPSPAHPLALAGEDPPPAGEGEATTQSSGLEPSEIALAALGVGIDRGDWVRTADSFDSAIEVAAAKGAFGWVVALCDARMKVGKAMFGSGAAAPGPPHPLALMGEDPPPAGEGEAAGFAVPPIRLRRAQRPPKGKWATWLFLGGRGAGKTLAGAMWLADMAERVGAGGRLALIGPTLHDVREVMIEGVSGIRALPRWGAGPRPVFEPSRRRLIFPNGAMAYAFSAEDPDSLRGPQFSAAWADEFCAWRNGGEVLALLRMGLRLALPGAVSPSPAGGGSSRSEGAGARRRDSRAPVAEPSPPVAASRRHPPRGGEEKMGSPLLCITTTPRPTAALRRLRAEGSCKETHAGTAENARHLSPGFLAGLEALYGGTRRAAQEIEGKVVEADGALFTAEMLARARADAGTIFPSPDGGGSSRSEGPGAARRDRARVAGALPTRPLRGHPPRHGEGEAPAAASPRFDRVVVAIDPTTTTGGNACGIVVAGRCGDRAVVLADRSAAGLSPEGWARRAIRAAQEFGARCIVAEVNQGGEMVRAVLKAAGSTLRLREVRATKGKRVRAEPVAALYEQGRVTHAGAFAALEEELMAFGGEEEGAYDLDRADALVWAITDLLIDRASDNVGPRMTVLSWGPEKIGLSNGLADWR